MYTTCTDTGHSGNYFIIIEVFILKENQKIQVEVKIPKVL